MKSIISCKAEWLTELPVELQRELNRARADGCRERAAEQRALHRSVRIGEIRMVERVEHLGAELEAILLLEEKILEYAKISGVHGIPLSMFCSALPKRGA